MIQFTVKGNPTTKKNSQAIHVNRRTGARFISQGAKYKEYAATFGWQVPAEARQEIDEPVTLTCIYYRATRHRVDLTNLLAATCDLLVDNRVLKDDNCKIIQSVDGSRVYHDKENPRVEITITKTKGNKK